MFQAAPILDYSMQVPSLTSCESQSWPLNTLRFAADFTLPSQDMGYNFLRKHCVSRPRTILIPQSPTWLVHDSPHPTDLLEISHTDPDLRLGRIKEGLWRLDQFILGRIQLRYCTGALSEGGKLKFSWLRSNFRFDFVKKKRKLNHNSPKYSEWNLA